MNFNDIDKLTRDSKQDFLYDLFEPTFKDDSSFFYEQVLVSSEEFMRMDSLSRRIIQTDDFVDAICNINYIDNPLNIMMGDTLKIPNVSQISVLRYEDISKSTLKKANQDAEKSSVIDPNRTKYVEADYKISPTQNNVPKDPIQVDQTTFKIG